jgi:hypothetical protein
MIFHWRAAQAITLATGSALVAELTILHPRGVLRYRSDLHDAADDGASTEAYRASCGRRKTQKGAQRALGPPRGPSPYHTPEGGSRLS